MFDINKIQECLKGFSCEWDYITSMESFIDCVSGLDTLTYVSELCQIKYQDFHIIGQVSINKVIVSIGNNDNHQEEYLFFLKKKDQSDNNFDNLYISVYYSNPLYWYSIKTMKNLSEIMEELIDLYSMKMIEDHSHLNKEVYAYMGTSSKLLLNPRAILSRLIISPFSEGFVWGPKYKDFPLNRELFSQLPLDVQYSELSRIMNQDNNGDDEIDDEESRSNKLPFTFSTKTMFSKSIIKFIDYHGIYVGRFTYRPCSVPNYGIELLNKELKRSYPLDLPIDLVISIEYYPFLDYLNILDKMDPIALCMVITRIIPPERNDLIGEVGVELCKMIKKENQKQTPDLETLYHLEIFRKHCMSSADKNRTEGKYATSYKKILKDREKRKEKYLADHRLFIKRLIYRTIQAECVCP